MNKIRIIPCRICGTNVVTVGSGGARAYCNEEHRKLGYAAHLKTKEAMISRAHSNAIKLYAEKIRDLDAQIGVLQARRAALSNIKDSMKHQWGLI